MKVIQGEELKKVKFIILCLDGLISVFFWQIFSERKKIFRGFPGRRNLQYLQNGPNWTKFRIEKCRNPRKWCRKWTFGAFKNHKTQPFFKTSTWNFVNILSTSVLHISSIFRKLLFWIFGEQHFSMTIFAIFQKKPRCQFNTRDQTGYILMKPNRCYI